MPTKPTATKTVKRQSLSRRLRWSTNQTGKCPPHTQDLTLRDQIKALRADFLFHKTFLENALVTASFSHNPHDTRYVAQKAPQPHPFSDTLTGPEDAIAFCDKHFHHLIHHALQEELHLVTLNGSHRVIRTHQITIGTLTSAPTHPREVFRPAILDSAAAIILVHNHPSGISEPSDADKAVTRQMQSAGKLIGIRCLDHIVVAREGSTSMMQWPALSIFE